LVSPIRFRALLGLAAAPMTLTPPALRRVVSEIFEPFAKRTMAFVVFER